MQLMVMTRLTTPAVLLFALVVSAFPAIAQRNALSEDEVFEALSASDRAVLYSLEPWDARDAVGERLHHFLILGKTELDRSKAQEAAVAFKEAISSSKNGAKNFAAASCFDPRQALRLTVNGHVYDFLLCYQCFKLEVFLDDESVAWLGASGSPDTLNRILTDAAIPLSKTGK
jgi:hypothetical protein